MSHRPATITEAEIARAIRAAKQVGAAEVEVRLDRGSRILIRLQPSTGLKGTSEPNGEIVL
jgi:hypothetical protein